MSFLTDATPVRDNYQPLDDAPRVPLHESPANTPLLSNSMFELKGWRPPLPNISTHSSLVKKGIQEAVPALIPEIAQIITDYSFVNPLEQALENSRKVYKDLKAREKIEMSWLAMDLMLFIGSMIDLGVDGWNPCLCAFLITFLVTVIPLLVLNQCKFFPDNDSLKRAKADLELRIQEAAAEEENFENDDAGTVNTR